MKLSHLFFRQSGGQSCSVVLSDKTVDDDTPLQPIAPRIPKVAGFGLNACQQTHQVRQQ
jgi:hypothetical protein